MSQRLRKAWLPPPKPEDMAKATTPTKGVGTTKLAHVEIDRRLDRQSTSIQSVDTKAGLVAGFAATAAQFLAGHGTGGFKVAAIAFYLLAFIGCMAALFVRSFSDAPSPESLGNLGEAEDAAIAGIVNNKIRAFAINRRRQYFKALTWKVGVAFLAVAVLLSVFALSHGATTS